MSQLVFSTCWSFKGVDTVKVLTCQQAQAGTGSKLPYSMSFIKAAAEEVAQIKSGSSHFKRSALKLDLSMSEDLG